MSTTKQTLSIYWQFTKPYKRQLWQMYPTMVVAQIGEDFIVPVLISGILSNLAAGKTSLLAFGHIWPLLLLIIILDASGHLIWNRIVVPLFWRTQDSVMRDLNVHIFKHLSNMSYRFFSDRFAGSLVSQTNRFVGSYERLTDPLTWNVFKLIVALIATSVVLVPRAPLVIAGIMLVTAIYIPLVWKYRRQQVPYNKLWASAETKRTGQLADAISNILAVKSFANEKFETRRMQERADDVHNRSMDTMSIAMRQEFVTGLVQRSINHITIVVSILLAVGGHVSVGTVYLSLFLVSSLLRRLWDLNNTFRQFTRVFGDATDMTEILQLKPEVKDPLDPKPFHAKKGEVELRDVSFSYPETDESEGLFEKFCLTIKPGEKIGLVGPSGGGKTTITKLLLRFMDIQDGEILIDDQNIAQVKQADLRHAITYVPQEPLLFHRSLTENIRYGNPDASEEEIVAASKKAHAHEFITKLPDGYETLVGERGVKLSGGQKQRVAIARSLLKDAPILVLDEATSALDSESEALIQKALWELMKNKTAIVIAHRLSTVKRMDRIVVLDDGKIVEEGTHAELHKREGGLYARLWSHQSGGFIEE